MTYIRARDAYTNYSAVDRRDGRGGEGHCFFFSSAETDCKIYTHNNCRGALDYIIVPAVYDAACI